DRAGTHHERLGDDAAPQSEARRALPRVDRDRRRTAHRVPAAVRLRLRRDARCRAGRPLRRTGGVRRLRRPRDPGPRHHRRRAGDGDRHRHGHDRGHHRPVPHHVDRPRVRAHRSRRRCGDPDADRAVDGGRRRPADRVPARGERRGVARGRRRPGDDELRAVVAVGGDGALDQDRRGRQQRADAADAPAVLRQRLRPGGLHAVRAALVRREPTVHPDHRDGAGPAHQHGNRLERLDLGGLVRRHRPGRLLLGPPELRAPSRPL
ncbi:MAG: Efflux ABC transporter, permease protein, partial [uncultured Blastococcus sp.]